MDTFLILSNNPLVSKENQIWGDGSWISPAQREALEGYMIAKMMGWKAEIISTYEKNWTPDPKLKYKWIILACDPNTISDLLMDRILKMASDFPSLFVFRCGKKNAPWHSRLGITFSGQSFTGIELSTTFDNNTNIKLIKPIEAQSIEAEEGQFSLIGSNENSITVQIKLGKSHVVGFGFNAIEKIDEHPEIFPLIKKTLTLSNPNTVAWIDWTGTVALRMDDPGSSELVHHEIYLDTPKLTENQWQEIGAVLDRFNAKLSIAYVNGWVDDGNQEKGELHVKGKLVKRQPGKVYPPQEVLFLSKENIKYDYVSEYESIQKLIFQEKVQVETHGVTHLYPDLNKWTNSPDKYSDINWFREFGPDAMKFIKDKSPVNHPLKKASKALNSYWVDQPMVMVFPSETFTIETQNDTLELGWKMISSYYQAFKIEKRFCWTQLIEALYLDQYDQKWSIKECPVVGYFHDFDLAKHGVDWLSNCLENWKKCGFKYFIDLRTLFIGYNFNLSISNKLGKHVLEINNDYYSKNGFSLQTKIKFSNYDQKSD